MMKIYIIIILGLLFSCVSEKNKRKMETNIFEIKHSEFGIEEFEIVEPKFNLVKTEGGLWEFTIYFDVSKSLKRSRELEDVIDAKPNFEATVILSEDSLKLESGRLLKQKEGYDKIREEYLTNIYYFEHNTVDDLEIRILEANEDWIIIEAKGVAIINGSNGNNPDSELKIHKTKFNLDKELERVIM